jgi:M6 family metalloprotease-like protein
MAARPAASRAWRAAVVATVAAAVAWTPASPTAAADPPPAAAENASGEFSGAANDAPGPTTAGAADVAADDLPVAATTAPVVGSDGLELDTFVPVANPPKAKKHVRVFIVPVYWSWNPRDSATPTSIKAVGITTLDRYFREVSRGRLGVSGKVATWTKISGSGLGCTGLESRLISRAVAAAKKKGFSTSSYDRLEIYHPTCGGYWAGMAELGTGSRPGRYLAINGYPDLSVYAHELGHTLGLDHANLYRCKASGARVTLSKSCSTVHYADAWDTMGAEPSAGSFSTPHLKQVGWLTAKQTKVVTKSVSGLRLTPLVGRSAGLKTIRIKASSTRTYWVELRTHAGVDSKLSPGGVGVQVRMTDSKLAYGRRGATLLLDLQPQNSGAAVTLPASSAWTSPEGVRISVSTQTTTSATVSVRFHAPKPTAPAAPKVTATAGDLLARVSVARPAGHGSVVQSYAIRAVPVGGGTTVTRTVDAAAGASRTTTLTGLKNGTTYAVSARARNEKGWSPWSAATRVTPVPLPPVVTLTSPAAGAVVSGTTLRVAGTVAPRAGSTAWIEGIEVTVTQPGGYGGDYLGGAWSAAHAFSTPVDVSDLTDGPATLTVTVTDSNERTTRVTRTFTVTGHAPRLAVEPATITGTVDGGFDLTYTATPGSRPLGGLEATLLSGDDELWYGWWDPVAGSATPVHADLWGGVDPGTYTLRLVLSDARGYGVTVEVPVTLT